MATIDENIKYWQAREKLYIEKSLKDEKALIKESISRFEILQKQLEQEINAWYGKYATELGISLADAKKKVETADIKFLEERAKKIVATKDFSPLANEQMRLYNLTMRINRYQYLLSDIGITTAEFYSEHEAFLYESFNKLAIDEYTKQAGVLGNNVKGSASTIDQIVTGSYQAGEQPNSYLWAEALWANQLALKNLLDIELTRAIIAGENPRKVARRIAKVMKVAKSNAERLARTEMARIQGEIQKDTYKKAKIDKYIFISEPTACDACSPLDGRIFGVKSQKIGVNVQPIHPNCRCSTAPYIDRDEMIARLKGEKPDNKSKLYGKKADPNKKNKR